MRNLSKSKLIAFRQCPKRLWLEVHRPELREDSAATEAAFAIGHEVGAVARRLYDPKGTGTTLNAQAEGYDKALARSKELLGSAQPVFEAGFAAEGAIAFADIMLPTSSGGFLGWGARRGWRMVEVKSSTSVKDYQREDAAIQAHVARAAGVPLTAIALARIDNGWTYQGDGDYRGLLVEEDVTQEAFARGPEVKGWIEEAQSVASERSEPGRRTGSHCHEPFECGFLSYCRSREPQAEHPVGWLPRQGRAVKEYIETKSISDLRDVPDDLLSEQQRRVKAHTISGTPYFDGKAAARELAPHAPPALFLDFESVQLAVPVWKGQRPYQQIPFQFSLHRLERNGRLEHEAFLDLTGEDPSERFARALVAACGKAGPIFVYNAAFETTRIKELAERFPALAPALVAIDARVVDLLPITRRHYYHPAQKGSWSIKSVLPTVAPDLAYDALSGVKDGGMAMTAYREAVAPATSQARREEIRAELLRYCRLDTLAMVRLWAHLAGRPLALDSAA